jgi:hypothetical protein
MITLSRTIIHIYIFFWGRGGREAGVWWWWNKRHTNFDKENVSTYMPIGVG